MSAETVIKGFIYKLCNTKTEDVYVGSTTQTLKQRLAGHLSSSNSIKRVKDLVNELGGDCFEIVCLEDVTVTYSNELRAKEQFWIECLKPSLNTFRAFIDPEIRRSENCKRAQKYRETHKEQRADYDRQYYETHKEQITEFYRQYREKNREYLTERFNCECGGRYQRRDKSTHFKTKRHLKWAESKE